MRTKHFWVLVTGLCWLALSLFAYGQDSSSGKIPFVPKEMETGKQYVLGPDDRISIHSSDQDTLADGVVRIDELGEINLPRIGRIHAAGLTVRQFETELVSRLRVYVKQPEVIVTVVEGRTIPVSVTGSVNHQGVVQVQGSKNLVEVITQAGGLTPDAGYSAKVFRKISRGVLPLAGATQDSTGQYAVGNVDLDEIMRSGNLLQNITVMPEDIIYVPRADMAYVLGEVNKIGGLVLSGRGAMPLMEVVTVAGGWQRTADPKHARILRRVPGAEKRQEIAVDLNKIFAGKAPDTGLIADDILYIPSSVSKKASIRALETILSMGTTALTYGVIYRPR